MAGKLRAVTQVFFALLLALSLGFMTAVPAMAQEWASLSPATAQYDLENPAEIITAITWGIASGVVGIEDDEGDLTPGLGNDYIVLVKHLIILNTYLEDELTDIGDAVELIVKFDVGAAILTITAIGTHPTISPTTGEYDLGAPADVKTTITWGTADDVVSLKDGDAYALVENTDYTVVPVDDDTAELVIRDPYLDGKLMDLGDSVMLTIGFDVGDDAAFNITAIGTPASLSPATATYDLDEPDDVTTTITWGAATEIEAITENGNLLAVGLDYTVTVNGDTATLAILDTYLGNKLPNIGDTVVLTIDFDVGGDATFTITAGGIQPGLSPRTEEYNLDNPADVETVVTWGTATQLVSIVDGDAYELAENVHYTVTPIDDDTATLLILDDPYLEGKLPDIGDRVVLTIEFDFGADVTFTITATGVHPVVSPQTEQYDLGDPADVETTITWGTATELVSIVDGDAYELVEYVDYSVTPIDDYAVTLVIFADHYLKGTDTDIGDDVVLTIDFDFGPDATFTVTALGTHTIIDPTTAEYDIFERGHVTTIIIWGTARSVVSIVDDDGFALALGVDYTVADVDPGVSANLTILGGSYLAGKLKRFGERVVLTIDFDLGRDATLSVTVPEVCFIATAAYGTPMAEEIEVLRAFRDEYLLTNPLGHALVDCYYKVSPSLAEFITEHPSVKPVVRAGLLPAVAISAIAVNATPVQQTVAVSMFLLIALVLTVWATRRRRGRPGYN